MKTPPQIEALEAQGNDLFAIIDGDRVRLETFKECFFRQGKVPLPGEYGERCESQWIKTDWTDEDSEFQNAEGLIHDTFAAGIMRDFALDKLKDGIFRPE